MKICVFGGDLRNRYLAEELEAAGFPCETAALGPGEIRLGLLADHDLVVGPVPFSRDGKTLHAPLAGGKIDAGAFLAALKPGAVLLAGTVPPGLSTEGVRCVDLTKDAALYEENLLPTREGIVQALLNGIDYTLHGSRVLLLGYGRVAKSLLPLLEAFGAAADVFSASPKETMELDARRVLGRLEDLSAYDIVVNTIPAVTLVRPVLATAKPGVFILDVASAPGGVDTAAAAGLGLVVHASGGLPGLKAPRTVARAMLRAVRPYIA